MLPQEAAERFNPRLIKFLGRATHEIHS
jgi:hypothetical protein